jgi:hypothetical protein
MFLHLVLLQSEEIYTYLDLYVGGSIQIFNRKFEMVEADEYTYTYMENNKVKENYITLWL